MCVGNSHKPSHRAVLQKTLFFETIFGPPPYTQCSLQTFMSYKEINHSSTS